MRAGTLPNILSCGVVAHPTVHQQMLHQSGPGLDDMFRQVKIPMLFCPAWNDPASFRQGGHYMKLLQKAAKGSRSVLFKDQLHGFANRSNLHIPKNRQAYEDFLRLTIEFLHERLHSHVIAGALNGADHQPKPIYARL